MKRRKFVAASLASTVMAGSLSASPLMAPKETTNEIYELKSYEMSQGGDKNALKKYFKEVLKPALTKCGAKHFLTFSEYGSPSPAKFWLLVAFPDFQSYHKSILELASPEFSKKAKEYTEAGKIYNRISSSLLYAFDGLKQMVKPIDGASLFELRIYEGTNEDAVQRKIKMFNNEELGLFQKLGMGPVFFGDMLVGPYVPSLVYMLNYKDMAHRDDVWGQFGKHPDWAKMKVKKEYANTVSNIRRIFLEPM